MKKSYILFMIILLLFTLTACKESNTIHKVVKKEKVFELDQANNTISDGTYKYDYIFSGDSSSYDIKIIYPNGATYYWRSDGQVGQGGWSDDYEANLYRYVDGDTKMLSLLMNH